MYKDCIDTAADSEDPELAEDILRFFVSVHDRECFYGTLFTCYALIKPDVVMMELAWRNGYTDFVMPYMIQFVKNLNDKSVDVNPDMDTAYGLTGAMPQMMAIAATAYNDPSTPYGGYAMHPNMAMGMQPAVGMNMGASMSNGMGKSNPYGANYKY
ncbi:hypothetical protein ABG067_005187 [Albugo candida]